MVSAKNNIALEKKSELSTDKQTLEMAVSECIPVFIQTSCGLNSYVTYCFDWPIQCLMSDAEAVEYVNCHD